MTTIELKSPAWNQVSCMEQLMMIFSYLICAIDLTVKYGQLMVCITMTTICIDYRIKHLLCSAKISLLYEELGLTIKRQPDEQRPNYTNCLFAVSMHDSIALMLIYLFHSLQLFPASSFCHYSIFHLHSSLANNKLNAQLLKYIQFSSKPENIKEQFYIEIILI